MTRRHFAVTPEDTVLEKLGIGNPALKNLDSLRAEDIKKAFEAENEIFDIQINESHVKDLVESLENKMFQISTAMTAAAENLERARSNRFFSRLAGPKTAKKEALNTVLNSYSKIMSETGPALIAIAKYLENNQDPKFSQTFKNQIFENIGDILLQPFEIASEHFKAFKETGEEKTNLEKIWTEMPHEKLTGNDRLYNEINKHFPDNFSDNSNIFKRSLGSHIRDNYVQHNPEQENDFDRLREATATDFDDEDESRVNLYDSAENLGGSFASNSTNIGGNNPSTRTVWTPPYDQPRERANAFSAPNMQRISDSLYNHLLPRKEGKIAPPPVPEPHDFYGIETPSPYKTPINTPTPPFPTYTSIGVPRVPQKQEVSVSDPNLYNTPKGTPLWGTAPDDNRLPPVPSRRSPSAAPTPVSAEFQERESLGYKGYINTKGGGAQQE